MSERDKKRQIQVEASYSIFQKLLPEMLKDHRGKYVIIKFGEEEIYRGYWNCPLDAYKVAIEDLGEDKPFILQEVTDEPIFCFDTFMKVQSKKKRHKDLLHARDSFLELINEMELEEDIIMTAGLTNNGIVAILNREVEEQEIQKLGLPTEFDGKPIEYKYMGGIADSHEVN